MRVAFVAAEVAPIAKVGGLGDVAGSLPKALHELGVDVRVVTGYYGTHDEARYPTRVAAQVNVPWGGRTRAVRLREATLPRSAVPVYLVDEPELVGGDGVYGSRTAMAEGQGETERFLLVARAAAELAPAVGWRPQLWHLHDWHAAALPLFLGEPHPPVLLTIHNLANQGWASPETLRRAGLGGVARGSEHVNLFRLGLELAAHLSTVSPSYAREVQTAPQGEGLEDVLARRSRELIGITNGIDVEVFNPATDGFLRQQYDRASVEQGKRLNRQALAQELGLRPEAVPLFGIVSRLTDQKGIELIPPAVEPHLKRRELQLVFLGVGDPVLEQLMGNLALAYPGYVAGALRFDERLARSMYAAADFFLMPSRFEPCGLGQLIAMRYGTVPIVRATGGLRDTVTDVALPGGTGIVFGDYAPASLAQALARALTLARDRATLGGVASAAMAYDASWAVAARQYLSLYTKLCVGG